MFLTDYLIELIPPLSRHPVQGRVKIFQDPSFKNTCLPLRIKGLFLIRPPLSPPIISKILISRGNFLFENKLARGNAGMCFTKIPDRFLKQNIEKYFDCAAERTASMSGGLNLADRHYLRVVKSLMEEKMKNICCCRHNPKATRLHRHTLHFSIFSKTIS